MKIGEGLLEDQPRVYTAATLPDSLQVRDSVVVDGDLCVKTPEHLVSLTPSGYVDVTKAPYFFPKDGSDCSSACDKLLLDLKNNTLKNRRIIFPFNGGIGYNFSKEIKVNFSKVTFHLEESVRYTGSTKSSLFRFVGSFGALSGYLSGVGITCLPGVVIDGGGSAISGYTYSTADTYYSSVLFMYCDKPFIINGTVTNGLVNSLRFWMCRQPLAQDVTATFATYDNGISVDFDPSFYSANDSETWASAKIIRCTGKFNYNGFGLTAFASTNNLWSDCTATNNGTITGTQGLGGVPGGGFSMERNPTDGLSFDYRARYKNCRSEYNYGNGWFITGSGGHIDSDCISKNNTYPLSGGPVTDTANIYGTGVTMIAVSYWTVDCDAENNTKYNIRYLGSGAFGNGIKIGAKALNSQFSGISLQGINEVTFMPTTHSRGNSVSSNGAGISVQNISGYNQGAGVCTILGAITSGNGGQSVLVDGLATAIIKNVSSRGDVVNAATTPAITAKNCGLVISDGCSAFGSTQTYALVVENTCAKSAITNVYGQGALGQVNNLGVLKLQSNGSFA